MPLLIFIGFVASIVWFIRQIWRGHDEAEEIPLAPPSATARQAGRGPQVKQAISVAVLRDVAERVAAREAKGDKFWEAAQAEAAEAGVPLFDVVGQINDDAKATDAAGEAARQAVFALRYKYDLADYADLRDLPSFRLRVKRMRRYTDKRASFLSGPCRLVREPENSHDPNAIMAFIGETRVGYVSATRAKLMAPLLDRIGRPVLIGADLTEARVVMLLPSMPGLREWVEEHCA